MPFEGKEKYVDFCLGYTDEAQDLNFSELVRLNDAINNAKGFNYAFKGIVCIDISEWVSHINDYRFIAFLEYLASNTDNWMIIFSILDNDKDAVKEVESLLAMYMRIEKIQFSIPETEMLSKYAVRILSSYGFELDDSGMELLENSLEKIRESEYFDGFPSVKRICSDIIYEKLSGNSDNKFMLTASDLKDFSVDGEYINRLIANYKGRKLNTIGFLEG